MNKKEKTITLLIKVIGLILFGMIINLFVHELSHLLILIFVNGEPIKMSFGEESFVGGYVEQKYISVVALASIYIPTIISLLMAFVKKKYLQILNAGFTVPIIVNWIMGVFAIFFVKDDYQRSTFDISLAIDNTSYDFIVYTIIAFVAVANVFAILRSFKTIEGMV